MHYLLIGAGRMATTLAAFVESRSTDRLGRWRRGDPPETLAAGLSEADAVLLAISDDALAPFVAQHGTAARGPIVHFSGARRIGGAHAFHPLAAFAPEPMPLGRFAEVVFVCDADGPDFDAVFPGWPNPHVRLDPAGRPLYHALAVLSGNLVSYLWNRTAEVFAERLTPDLPPEKVLAPYFRSLLANFDASPTDSLTGPVRRRDAGTVATNLRALEDHPELSTLYRAFLEAAWPDYPRSKD